MSSAKGNLSVKDLGGNHWMTEMAELYGYSPRIAQAAIQILSGTPEPYYDDILVADIEFMHRIAYPAAGATNFTFFNVAESKGVIDMPGNGAGLPKNHCYIYTGMSFELTTGIDINAAADADGAQFQITGTEAWPGVTEFPVKTAEQIRRILANGDVTLFVNNNVTDRMYGLHRAPQAGGAQCQVAIGGTTTAQDEVAAAVVCNGDPSFANRRLVRRQAIFHNAPIKLNVDFTTALALTSAGVLTARLFGTLIKPRN